MTHASKLDRTLAAGALLLLAFFAAVPRDAALWLKAIPVGLSGLVLAISMASPSRSARIALLVFTLSSLFLTGLVWQGVMAIALLVVFAAARLDARFGPARPDRGNVPALYTFVCAGVTPLALLGWVRLLEPDLTPITSAIAQLSLPALLLLGAAFAVVNAALEEWLWRGLLQTDLTALFGVPLAVLLQGLSFGSVHAHGFPSGVVGVTLAGIWGIMLGALRVHSGGLLAPTLAHVVADATIAAIVIGRIR